MDPDQMALFSIEDIFRFSRTVLYFFIIFFIIHVQCSSFITHLIKTQIWIKHGHAVAPKFFNPESLQRNYSIFFSYSYVKLSIYHLIRL